jgi:hypothetical protein
MSEEEKKEAVVGHISKRALARVVLLRRKKEFKTAFPNSQAKGPGLLKSATTGTS